MIEVVSETAVWYSTGLFAVPVRWVLVRDPQGEFKTQALLCTNLEADPKKIVSWFVMRWQLEVTFQEMRRHLGFETQRQWSELAIRRTTPALLGLFSLIALLAHQRMRQAAGTFRRQAAWYHKRHPTFADALAYAPGTFFVSLGQTNTQKVALQREAAVGRFVMRKEGQGPEALLMIRKGQAPRSSVLRNWG